MSPYYIAECISCGERFNMGIAGERHWLDEHDDKCPGSREARRVQEMAPDRGMRRCPHGYHHPYPFRPDSPHSCDGCYCEGHRDRREYGWPHDTTPKEWLA